MRIAAVFAAVLVSACIPGWERVLITFDVAVEQSSVGSFLEEVGFVADSPKDEISHRFRHRDVPTISCVYPDIVRRGRWSMSCTHEELVGWPSKRSSELPPEKQALMRSLIAQFRDRYGKHILSVKDPTGHTRY